ncbi:hypothetical protein [Serinicoccus sp. LYQ131]|uniref:hypothetical protein n=1 Tax=Serinicoccus sp. LYQ131 TaxID=3378797 RepID=UPI003851AC72
MLMLSTITEPESITEARTYDDAAEALREHTEACDSCVSRAVYSDGERVPVDCARCRNVITSDGEMILRYLYAWTDYAVNVDLDCAAKVCITSGDVSMVKRYAALRRAGKDWRPSKSGNRNHPNLKRADLDNLTNPAKSSGVECAWCGEPFGRGHGHVRYCTDQCRRDAANYRRRAA